MSLALTNLGRVQLHAGDYERARGLFRDALALGRDRGDKRVAAECIQGIAAALGAQGDASKAARLFGAAEALLETIGATPSPPEEAITERFVPPVREALGEDAFTSEWAGGRATSHEDAIELAMQAASGAASAATGALAPSA
jgi:tetratricopeptide (TPR) repeat protein